MHYPLKCVLLKVRGLDTDVAASHKNCIQSKKRQKTQYVSHVFNLNNYISNRYSRPIGFQEKNRFLCSCQNRTEKSMREAQHEPRDGLSSFMQH